MHAHRGVSGWYIESLVRTDMCKHMQPCVGAHSTSQCMCTRTRSCACGRARNCFCPHLSARAHTHVLAFMRIGACVNATMCKCTQAWVCAGSIEGAKAAMMLTKGQMLDVLQLEFLPVLDLTAEQQLVHPSGRKAAFR